MMPLALLLQKLEQLIGTLAPKLKPQNDVAMLEKIVVDLCQSEVAAGSPLGLLIGGPKKSSTLPASRPSWQPEELAGQRDQLYMPNGRRPTVSCKQVIAKIGYMSRAMLYSAAGRQKHTLGKKCFHQVPFCFCITLLSLYAWHSICKMCLHV